MTLDIFIVAIGQNVQASILTTIILKELGVNKTVAKAQNALHGKLFEKVGADLVIYPERDMALKLAKTYYLKIFWIILTFRCSLRCQVRAFSSDVSFYFLLG